MSSTARTQTGGNGSTVVGMPAAVSRTAVGVIVFVVAVAAFSRIPLLPDVGGDLSLTVGEIGLLTTAFGLGRLGTDLPAGRLTQAAPAYVGLAGAGTLLALSCGLLAIAGSLAVALVASALIGCASALTNTTGMFAFATATGPGGRGASMALFTTALMTGQMVGPALGGMLGGLLGWREAIAIAGLIGAAVAGVCLWWRRSTRNRLADEAADADPADNDARGGEEAPRDRVETEHVSTAPPPSRRELFALAATPFACFFALAGLTQTLIPVIGNAELDLSAGAIGLAIAAGAAVRFVAAFVTGVASDRYSRKVVLVPSLVLMALGAVAIAFSEHLAWWASAIALIAIGSSGISIAAAGVADRVPAHRLGHELGMFRLVGDLGLLAGPAVVAFLYQEHGPELAGVVSAAVFAGAALVAALWVAPARRRAPDTGELIVD